MRFRYSLEINKYIGCIEDLGPRNGVFYELARPIHNKNMIRRNTAAPTYVILAYGLNDPSDLCLRFTDLAKLHGPIEIIP